MSQYVADKIIDCKGLSCPMPIIRTKGAIEQIDAGQVLRVIATDPGSVADVKSWASRMGHHFLGTEEYEGTFHHYIRKAHMHLTEAEARYEQTISNEGLLEKLDKNPVIIDVRDPKEFVAGHIPNAQSIPLESLEDRLSELDPYRSEDVFIICRSGSRSESACHILSKNGFQHAINVSEGMRSWHGPIA